MSFHHSSPNRGSGLFDPNAEPPRLQPCPACTAVIDLTGQEPLSEVVCPGCSGPLIVEGHVDHFELLSIAGRGGMGVVYRARDAGLDREVAIKLLRGDQPMNAELISQLETEAAITASVNHPHVVKVYSTGTDEGRFFIAMELVSEGSLDDVLRLEGRVAEGRALEIGIQIADGLRAAHQHGLIHRDVKPGNILFAGPHTAKIVDFGLAIFMAQEEAVRGEIWGTPYYVAPEKLDRKAEDFRSDIYSLGGTLFHALCGRPPFEAESASLVALKHLKSEAVSLQAFAPWVSGATAYVINRTLSKDPNDRYQSYDELIEHLAFAKAELEKKATSPIQVPTRVVLETEQTQKAMGWLTFAMLGVILFLAGAAFVFRDAIFSPRGKNVTPAPATRAPAPVVAAAAKPQGAWKTLVSGDASQAATAFQELGERNPAQPEANWSALGEGLAHLVARNAPEAQKAFSKIGGRGSFASTGEAGKLSEFFLRISRSLDGNVAIDPGVAARFESKNHESIALLLFGVKNWNLGKVDEAATLLRQFRSAAPAGDAAWIADLKPLATRYLGQYAAFQVAADELKNASGASDRSAAVKALQDFPEPLAGRARELIAPFANQLTVDHETLSRAPGPGLYKIINRNSGRVLDLGGHKLEDQAPVGQWEYVGGRNQLWRLDPAGNGFVTLTADHSGKALDVPNGSPVDGATIQQFKPNGSSAQRWKLIPIGEGWFKIASEATGKVLAVHDQSRDNGGRVTQWADNGTPDHEWAFVQVGQTDGEWLSRDLGRDPLPGKTTIDPQGTFTVQAAGHDIWNAEDSCRVILRPVRGDFEFSARVTGISNTHEWAKAALTARETLLADARNVAAAQSATQGVGHQRRSAPGAESTSVIKPGVQAPQWLKIVRRGDSLATFHSSDGRIWIALGEDTFPNLAEELQVGLAATSHDNTKLTTATFDSVVLKK